jgi:hypothetical protein
MDATDVRERLLCGALISAAVRSSRLNADVRLSRIAAPEQTVTGVIN